MCRKCYIHPATLDAYFDGATIATMRARAGRLKARGALSQEERAVVDMIAARLDAGSRKSA